MQTANPIHEALQDAGIPWRASRAELAERYGIRRHAVYDRDVIEIGSAKPMVDGLLWPLSAEAAPRFAADLPATQFCGVARMTEDALENFRSAVRQLVPRLGPGETLAGANSIERCWAYGASRLRLVVWPPAMQQWVLTNPAHDRDPRLKTACHLFTDTGFRPAATATELTWLATFEPLAAIDPPRTSDGLAAQCPASEDELEYVREPPDEAAALARSVGLSADRAALIFYGEQLYLIPIADVVGFHVTRTLPAKGPGGSRLQVECRSRAPGPGAKRLTVTEGQGTDDLDALALELAEATARPLGIGACQYDA